MCPDMWIARRHFKTSRCGSLIADTSLAQWTAGWGVHAQAPPHPGLQGAGEPCSEGHACVRPLHPPAPREMTLTHLCVPRPGTPIAPRPCANSYTECVVRVCTCFHMRVEVQELVDMIVWALPRRSCFGNMHTYRWWSQTWAGPCARGHGPSAGPSALALWCQSFTHSRRRSSSDVGQCCEEEGRQVAGRGGLVQTMVAILPACNLRTALV